MKSNRGITLTSLIIYIICLLIITGIISTFTKYFYKNIDEITIQNNAEEQYARFTAYLTNSINSENLDLVLTGNQGETTYLYLKFANESIKQFVFQNNTIYYIEKENDETKKKITLCQNVNRVNTENSIFDYKTETGKLDILFTIDSKEFNNTYYVQ